ncbi:MAG: hypothetical protein A2Z15_08915 [Chloroflexi bacterium RBG_16_50_11]|nr:MAG: hypothetical protein A2Z15_08915 [Chloroflexi bacterium RBG_16_50_11]
MNEKDKYLTQLYAGLTVLSRDIHQYLSEYPRDDGNLFENVITAVSGEERLRYGSGAFPYNDSYFTHKIELSSFPTDLAKKAAEGNPNIESLGNANIRHEWTVKVGKKLFLKFGEKFKSVICGKDGPHEQLENKLLNQATLPAAIVSAILTNGFSTATFWYPLAVYIALLLVKTGLKTYCE